MMCFRCNGPTPGHALLCESCQHATAEEERRRKLTPAQRRYEDTFGREAAERQIALAAELWACCGEHRDDGHHEACSKRPTDPAPAVVEGQESLL